MAIHLNLCLSWPAAAHQQSLFPHNLPFVHLTDTPSKLPVSEYLQTSSEIRTFCQFTQLLAILTRPFPCLTFTVFYSVRVLDIHVSLLLLLISYRAHMHIFLFYFFFYLLPSRILDPLRFQAGGRRRRPNLGLVCFVLMLAVFLVKDTCVCYVVVDLVLVL